MPDTPAGGGRPFRVLVTGSRTWADAPIIYDALESVRHNSRQLVVVHGAAERGADKFADRWAMMHGVPDWVIAREPHPADWDGACRPGCKPGHRRMRKDGAEYCPAAGNYRNAEMVGLGAELCLAFIMPCADLKCHRRDPHGTHGAAHCAGLAEKAGIPVRRFTAIPGCPGREVTGE